MRVEPAAYRPAAAAASLRGAKASQAGPCAGPAADTTVPAADGTTLSADASAYLTAQRAASSALRDRAQQVKALRSSVNSGDYRVPPDALYDALTAVLTQGGEFR